MEGSNGNPQQDAVGVSDRPLGQIGWRAPEMPVGGSPFPPIADYGFLSDCETVALVAPSGNIEWMCLPRLDSPSVFGAMLDRGAGSFKLGPIGVNVPASRRYLPGTMVLETSWWTGAGWIIVRDALLIGSWHHEQERSHTHRRAPTDYDADHVLLRTVRCVNGEVEIALDCEPAADYGQKTAQWEYVGDTYHEGITDCGEYKLGLRTDLRLGFEGARATARHRMKEGEQVYVALYWSDHEPPQDFEQAYKRLVWTAHHWQHWLDGGDFPDHPWRSFLQRSALTLKGLTYAPTGALIAAATTSLPETPRGERNWDYRYSWIRDSTFMLWALLTLGFDWEANDYFYFVADVAGQDHDARLQVMYGVDGERELEEQKLDHLSGYEGAKPVRIGNDAYRQEQHDVWGALLDSVFLHTRSRDSLDERVWVILSKQVEAAIENWRKPDRGIWEVRGEPKHFTSSKMFCWVACDRGAKLAQLREDTETAERWQKVADEIHADICENGVDERGVFVQHYDTNALDAALLLMPLLRFLQPDDERIRKTVLAIHDELTDHGLVLRYRVDETDDGMSGEEGTFLICSFWLVSALVEIGELGKARDLCERVLGYASPLGLYAEEVDPRTGRHLGNFPQAFTHLALINAVMHVIRADEQLTLRQSPFDESQ